jgi:hypothetical protein
MCFTPLSQPINRSDPGAMNGRFFQVMGNAIAAGQGNADAKARLQQWKSMIGKRP